MTDIYEQHNKAFSHVAAYVVLKDGERVATIAFKFPKDGAGRLYAYVHWLGVEMVRGHANGYGYDKKSAAVESAVSKIQNPAIASLSRAHDENWYLFTEALASVGGSYWHDKLRDAGFTVLQAV